MTTDGCGGSSVLALDDLLVDFKTQQRELLLLAVDKAITSAIVNQSEMLDAVKSKVEARHRQAVDELRSELQKTQPSLLDQVIAQTLTVDLNPGLTSWIQDQDKKDEARDCIKKLQEHLKGRQGNAFRSDFEALLVVYMDFLQIPMTRGARLNFRIEDFKEALHEKATDELLNLVYRVRWGCNGVRTIGNARSHDATPLSDSEILELCGCFSAIGAAMPTLALEFEACKSPASPTLPAAISGDVNSLINGNSGAELASLIRQAGGDESSINLLLQIVANGMNTSSTASSTSTSAAVSPPRPPSTSSFQESQSNQASSLLSGFNGSLGLFSQSTSSESSLNGSSSLSAFPPGFNSSSSLSSLSSPALYGQTPPLPPGLNRSSSQSSQVTLSSSPGLYGSSGQVPPLPPGLSRSLSLPDSDPSSPPSLFGSIGHGSIGQAPPLPPGYNNSVGGTWGQPPLPSDSGSPDKKSQLAPPADFAKKETDKPSQAMLKLVPTFKFYYDRPTELPKENDRTRMAMFARMINHINALPKATLCPFLKGHDPTCPLSHTYLEVMTYNPLFKRLICRQTSHYWGNQIQEDENCACVHVDTGLTWEWMEESRDKRLYCPRGSKCTNNKCIKSHSFEEMCWYNPSYKTKKCEKRAHDYIIRSRGTMTPPLDCHYYHFEEGRNADKREFSIEDDHVGKPVKMLFIERSHKPLADALEALRYARANNL